MPEAFSGDSSAMNSTTIRQRNRSSDLFFLICYNYIESRCEAIPIVPVISPYVPREITIDSLFYLYAIQLMYDPVTLHIHFYVV